MKKIIFFSLLFGGMSICLHSQSEYKIKIFGVINITTIPTKVVFDDCKHKNYDLAKSLMVNTIIDKITTPIIEDKEYSILIGAEGYEEKVFWTIENDYNIDVTIETNSVWIGRLLYMYLDAYNKSNCFPFNFLKKYERDDLGNLEDSLILNFTPKGGIKFPAPSAKRVLPERFFANIGTLKDLSYNVSHILKTCGYEEVGFYEEPINKSFSIITRIEQINKDGRIKAIPNERWTLKMKPEKKFTIIQYLKMLMFQNKGYYRMFVFKYQPDNYSLGSSNNTAVEDFETILDESSNKLSAKLGEEKYQRNQKESNLTVLIYEFECTEFEKEAIFIKPSRLNGKLHLEKSGIWRSFESYIKP